MHLLIEISNDDPGNHREQYTLFDAVLLFPPRLFSANGTAPINVLSLKNRFPTCCSQSNLKELTKEKTFTQLVKGTVMKPGAKVDLSFPEDVGLLTFIQAIFFCFKAMF